MAMAQGMTCLRCGRGTLSPQTVDETVVVGSNAVQVIVPAEVCSFCGEHWLGPDATAALDEAIERLRTGDLAHLTPIGELYRAS